MAVTSMWPIHGRLDQVIDYIRNEDKTIEENDEMQFVTCLNCNMYDPKSSMLQTKKLFHDTSDILAFHGYQAFKPGEVSPEIAHEIGVKLAEKLFANQYETIVTTHLDKGHIHNHILINSTSFINGKRFCNTKKDGYKLRETSDQLCREYGLSVIEKSNSRNKKVDYNAKKTYMNDIKKDIDLLVQYSRTVQEFISNMHLKGYEFIRDSDDDYICHPYLSQPIPLSSLGEKYHMDSIKDTIIYSRRPIEMVGKINSVTTLKNYYHKYKRNQLFGLEKLYIQHFVIHKVLPKTPRKLSPEIRKELKKLDQYTLEIELLSHYKIKSIDELDAYQSINQKELDRLLYERKKCYYQRQHTNNPEEKEKWSKLAKEFTPDIKKYREQVKACQRIRERSFIKYREKELKIESRTRER